jgi:hypothetical protein
VTLDGFVGLVIFCVLAIVLAPAAVTYYLVFKKDARPEPPVERGFPVVPPKDAR